MLYCIPPIITPDLLKVLMEMGHGDQLVITDGNFPAYSIAKSTVTGTALHQPGCTATAILDAILKLLPLDNTVETPVICMAAPPEMGTPPIHQAFTDVLRQYGYQERQMAAMDRFAFYRQARQSYAVLKTGEKARYANLILQKGIITQQESITERPRTL
jgi:L-fucose mutarotase